MLFTPDFRARLAEKDPLAIQQAHDQLLSQGYSFVGYHGSNLEALTSILTNGFDPKRAGSASGLARGAGFYVAANRKLALDFADNSTQAGDPNPKTGEIPRRPGDKGKIEVMLVYARDFKAMRLGRDYTWGVMSSAGDQNQDKRIQAKDTRKGGLAENRHDLELVFRPEALGALFVLPSLGPDVGDPRAQWKAHESPI